MDGGNGEPIAGAPQIRCLLKDSSSLNMPSFVGGMSKAGILCQQRSSTRESTLNAIDRGRSNNSNERQPCITLSSSRVPTFPAPLWPSRAVICPEYMVRSSLSTASLEPPTELLYTFVRPEKTFSPGNKGNERWHKHSGEQMGKLGWYPSSHSPKEAGDTKQKDGV